MAVPIPVQDAARGGALPGAAPRLGGRARALGGPLVWASLIVIAAVVVAALAPGVIWRQDPLALNPDLALHAPGAAAPLGADQYGRSILGQLVFGARNALLIGVGSVVGGAVVGGAIGLVAGYESGTVDMLLMRLIDVLMLFPGILLALLIASALGASLTNEVLAVAVASIPGYARVMRGQVLAVRGRPYIDAAIAVGVPPFRVLWRHVLPNALAPLVVLATVGVGTAIVVGASLSFLGLGPQNGVPDWGRLLAAGEPYLSTAWWISTFPGLLITAVVIAVNMLGDRLRDVLDVNR